ncbi:hypothetical protein ACPCUF_00785 [Streptomyces griseoincarnatus]
MNSHHRYAVGLAAGSALCAAAGLTLTARALDATSPDGPWVPVAGCAYASLVLAWGALREAAAGRRIAAETTWHAHTALGETPPPLVPCCVLAEEAEGLHSPTCTRPRGHGHHQADTRPGPAHGGPLRLGEYGDMLCVRPAGDAHSDHVPYRPRVEEDQ